MKEGVSIRAARDTDAGALLAIYRPIVLHTTTSFEEVPPTTHQFARRIQQAQEKHAWLVAETAEGIVGYAYATPHRSRAAYAYTVETSIYIHTDQRRQGVGYTLYQSLFERLRMLNYFTACAIITLPNTVSVAFHQSMGFEPVGVIHRAGYKFGAWQDVSWWQLRLQEGDPSPSNRQHGTGSH